jgi:hypothetical protein
MVVWIPESVGETVPGSIISRSLPGYTLLLCRLFQYEEPYMSSLLEFCRSFQFSKLYNLGSHLEGRQSLTIEEQKWETPNGRRDSKV